MLLNVDELIEILETNRIDVDMETFDDPYNIKRAMYERANEMLDTCIDDVKRYFYNKETNYDSRTT